MSKLAPIYLRVTTFVHDRAAKLRERREHGQNTMEYLGLAILIAVALVVALTGAREPLMNLANNFVTAVRGVLTASSGG